MWMNNYKPSAFICVSVCFSNSASLKASVRDVHVHVCICVPVWMCADFVCVWILCRSDHFIGSSLLKTEKKADLMNRIRSVVSCSN